MQNVLKNALGKMSLKYKQMLWRTIDANAIISTVSSLESHFLCKIRNQLLSMPKAISETIRALLSR